jgi:hypothetical protein
LTWCCSLSPPHRTAAVTAVPTRIFVKGDGNYSPLLLKEGGGE